MINRIVASYILFACLLAVALKLGGVEGTIHFGDYFRAYLVQCNQELQDFKIAIPSIEKIVPITEDNSIHLGQIDSIWDVLQYVKYIWYQAVTLLRIEGLINGIVDFLNILIGFINTLIQVVELIFIFVKNLIVMKDVIINA